MARTKSHHFTLILSGVSQMSPELAGTLYEATDGCIECNMRNGITFLEFTRHAPNLRAAVLPAIREVEGAGLGVRVVRVESEVANTIAKINAELLGMSDGQALPVE